MKTWRVDSFSLGLALMLEGMGMNRGPGDAHRGTVLYVMRSTGILENGTYTLTIHSSSLVEVVGP